MSSGGSLSWVHPHVKVYFVIIKDVFIFYCPVGALKRMFLLSSAQQGSDPVFTFTTLLAGPEQYFSIQLPLGK